VTRVQVDEEPGILGAPFQACHGVFQVIEDAGVEYAVYLAVTRGVVNVANREVRLLETLDRLHRVRAADAIFTAFDTVHSAAHLRQFQSG